jgi:hypothetical protein
MTKVQVHMQVVIDIQMNTEKFGSGVEITGVQVITGGHTVGLQQMVTHITKDTEDNINSINTKGEK